MLKNSLRALVLGGAVLFAGGSATIIKGTSQPVTINTYPPGATVYVDNQPVGYSPVTVALKHDDHTVSVALPGYAPAYARLTAGFSGWTLLAFPFGMIIDAVTGAITTLDQEAVVIQLVPGGPAAGAPALQPQRQPQPPPQGDSPVRH